MIRYIKNVLIAIDQLFNAILLGDPDETISSRLGKMFAANRDNVFARILKWAIESVDKDHFENSIESDEGADAIA